jgi:hypothetical protein
MKELLYGLTGLMLLASPVYARVAPQSGILECQGIVEQQGANLLR